MKRMIALVICLVGMLVGCGMPSGHGSERYPEPVIDESKLPSILFVQRHYMNLDEDVDYDFGPCELFFYDKNGDYYLCKDSDVYFMDDSSLIKGYDEGTLDDKIELYIDCDDRDDSTLFKEELQKQAAILQNLYIDGTLKDVEIEYPEDIPAVEPDGHSNWVGLYFDSKNNIQSHIIHEREVMDFYSTDDTVNEIYEWLKDSFKNVNSSSSTTNEVDADAMRIESHNNVEFYLMRVNEDYLNISVHCGLVYLLPGGEYPELADGQIAKVVADVDVYDGGENGYMGNYFIKDLKSQDVVTYEDVDNTLYIPNSEDNTFDYNHHILSYQLGEKWYFIVMNRSYVAVYEDGIPFMDYQYETLDNPLVPFFEKIEKDYMSIEDDLPDWVPEGYAPRTEVTDDYIAVFHGGSGENTYQTYVYKIDTGSENMGFECVNTNTYGMTMEQTKVVLDVVQVTWTDDVFTAAEANGANRYVMLPDSSETYTLDEFADMFLMN